MQLADTSAWVWTRAIGGELRAAFDEDLVEGQIATCDMVRLELLYSTRNATEFIGLRHELEALTDCPIGVEQWRRALEVYEQLAHQGSLHHRAVRHPDLLIAAAGEAAGVPVLHYDEDYDRIASVTGQDIRWLAPRGSLKLSHQPPPRASQLPTPGARHRDRDSSDTDSTPARARPLADTGTGPASPDAEEAVTAPARHPRADAAAVVRFGKCAKAHRSSWCITDGARPRARDHRLGRTIRERLA